LFIAGLLDAGKNREIVYFIFELTVVKSFFVGLLSDFPNTRAGDQ
jgi:hypothetical protein